MPAELAITAGRRCIAIECAADGDGGDGCVCASVFARACMRACAYACARTRVRAHACARVRVRTRACVHA